MVNVTALPQRRVGVPDENNAQLVATTRDSADVIVRFEPPRL